MNRATELFRELASAYDRRDTAEVERLAALLYQCCRVYRDFPVITGCPLFDARIGTLASAYLQDMHGCKLETTPNGVDGATCQPVRANVVA